MTICQSCIVSQWFKGKELAFAFGINLSVARLGSVLNGIIEPQIAGSSGTPAAIWFGLYICIFSWCCGMVLVVIDSYADKKDGTVAKLGDDDKFKCRQICEFSLPFWLIAVSCVTVYCAIFPYNTYCAVMLEREWNLSENFAGAIYSLPFLISAGVSPFLGLAIDKYGKRALMIMSSSLFIVVACVLTAILVVQDYTTINYSFIAPLVFLGLAYSIYAGALWSSVPYVVRPNELGTAFGLLTSIQNIGLTILPLAVAATI